MADYWKSHDRKYCDFCKCWISDNKSSISFHENGKRHKMNVVKRINLISRNSEKAEKEQRQLDAEIHKMEKAALCAYAKDVHVRKDLTAHLNVDKSTKKWVPEHNETICRQIDPLRLSVNSNNEPCYPSERTQKSHASNVNNTLWIEGKSDEGHIYYWNVKTGQSVWEVPVEGYLSWEEFQSINNLAVKQQEVRQVEESKRFRENINEEMARYNRERLKLYRVSDTLAVGGVLGEYTRPHKIENEIDAPKIGSWTVIEKSPSVTEIDFELPKLNKNCIEPAIVELTVESHIKRFKNKTIQSLKLHETKKEPSTIFKKRKISALTHLRKPLEED